MCINSSLQLALAEKNGIKNVCHATPDVVICHLSRRIQTYLRKFNPAICICCDTLLVARLVDTLR